VARSKGSTNCEGVSVRSQTSVLPEARAEYADDALAASRMVPKVPDPTASAWIRCTYARRRHATAICCSVANATREERIAW
jgi:hypothetical protein